MFSKKTSLQRDGVLVGLQFATYKESLKSNKQYKSSKALVQSNVGVLCMWFEHYKEDDPKFHCTNERPLGVHTHFRNLHMHINFRK